MICFLYDLSGAFVVIGTRFILYLSPPPCLKIQTYVRIFISIITIFFSSVKRLVKKEEMKYVEIEIMLQINRRLFQQGLITEEMYRLAKEEFIRT